MAVRERNLPLGKLRVVLFAEDARRLTDTRGIAVTA